jgi:hypothetical protein
LDLAVWCSWHLNDGVAMSGWPAISCTCFVNVSLNGVFVS